MSKRLQVYRVDAFTSTPCTGNPAGVVLGAERLDTRELQSIARELGGVDVAFILPPDSPDHDLRLRFFTPRTETGLVGHATVAAHAVLDKLGHAPLRRQKQRGALVDIERLDGPRGRRYAFSQTPAPLHGALPEDKLLAACAALGVGHEELDPDCPSVVAGPGGSRALIAVRTGTTLARLRPDMGRLAELSASGLPAGFFVYSLSPAVPDCDTEARMFCPAIGIPEDPVSGNAHAMLATQLQALGKIADHGTSEFTGRQGHHIRRAGVVEVRVSEGASGMRQVRVAGSARIVFDATLEL